MAPTAPGTPPALPAMTFLRTLRHRLCHWDRDTLVSTEWGLYYCCLDCPHVVKLGLIGPGSNRRDRTVA